MDSLTQIVLGAAAGEAVLGKKVGNKAMLWGAIAGTIPDLDVFAKFFTDPITADFVHRGFSHSLLFSILMSPILGWLVVKLHHKEQATFKGWTMLFFAALVTHPLLDAHTDYGTQFFWPFEYRLAYKNIFVADPLYTVPFLICTIGAMFFKRTNPIRRKWNYAGIIISSAYMVTTIALKGIGWQQFKTELEQQNITYTELDTRPTPLNAILWNAQIKTDKGYRVAYYSLFDQQPITFSKEYLQNDELLQKFENDPVIQQIKIMSQGLYFVEQHEGYLLFNDMRFGQMGFDANQSPNVLKYEIREENGVLRISKLQPEFKEGMFSKFFFSLWQRIKGN